LTARDVLERAAQGDMHADELPETLATHLQRLVVLYHQTEKGNQPILTKGNRSGGKWVAAFSDWEAVRIVWVEHPETLIAVEEPAFSFLVKAFRSNADGVVFNPGWSSRLFVPKPVLHKLVRETAVLQLARQPGVWVPTLNQNLLLVEYRKGVYTVAVYATEVDAMRAAARSGGVPIHYPWKAIWERCRQLGAEAPYLHFGLPEHTPLELRHAELLKSGHMLEPLDLNVVERPFVELIREKADPAVTKALAPKEELAEKAIVSAVRERAFVPAAEENVTAALGNPPTGRAEAPFVAPPGSPVKKPSSSPLSRPVDPDVEAGLKKLERATIEGQGMANGWEVCRAMAELRRIWVIVDHEGNMVILAGQEQSPIVDFFTSERHARILIEEAHRKNPQLPPMTPRLVSTKKLYRALAPRKPIVWINRGSPEAWTSIMGDTLPYVLQLMEQLEQEKKS
jgi:hypothetical protein